MAEHGLEEPEWELGAPIKASPNDPIVHGMRWRRERDEARTEVERLQAIVDGARSKTALDVVAEKLEAETKFARLRAAAKRVLEADMLGVRDIEALNALEDAAGFTQQGQRR